MAVFPDKIVLKNSTDDKDTIKAAIASGGSDAIIPGELVVGRGDKEASLYTVDQNGDIVTISGGGSGGSESLAGLIDTAIGANAYRNGFESGDPAYTLGTGSSINTTVLRVEDGTNALKSTGTNGLSVLFDTATVDQSKRYDFWNVAIMSDNPPSSSYYLPLGGVGGSLSETDGVSVLYRYYNVDHTLYFNGTGGQGFTITDNNNNSNQDRDEFIYFTVLLDWGTDGRVNGVRTLGPQRAIIWADGRKIAQSGVQSVATRSNYIPADEMFFRFPELAVQGSQNRWLDTVTFGQSDTLPFPDATSSYFLAWDSASEAMDDAPADGEHLGYDSSQSAWEPVAAPTDLSDLQDVNYSTEVDPYFDQVTHLNLAESAVDIATGVTGTTYSPGTATFQTGLSPIGNSIFVNSTPGEGANANLYYPANTGWDLGSGDFTLEFWAVRGRGRNCTALRKVNQMRLSYEGGTVGTSSGGWLRFYYYQGGVEQSFIAEVGNRDSRAGRWHHCACTRSGGTLYIFLDGVLFGTKAISGAIDYTTDDSYAIYLADEGQFGGSRITKGVARWTATFTPPTSFPKTGTGVSEGEALFYNSLTSKWEPGTIPPSAIVAVDAPTQRADTSALQVGDLWWESDTQSLYVYYNSAWKEIGGGAGGGRGDGGDFSAGAVSATFVMGVYGGGDFTAGTNDSPVELLNGDEGPDGGTF